MFGPNLVVCHLATWAENAVKFKLKISKKWKRKQNKNELGMEWETKCGSLYLFFMILQYFCRFFQNSNVSVICFFIFFLSKRTLYVGGSKFESGINYSKHKLPQD